MKFDPSKVTFPSDNITYGAVRRTQFNPEVVRHTSRSIEAVYKIETIVAEKVFAKVTGQPDPHPDDSIAGWASTAYSSYRICNLASGTHHAKQLMRTFIAEVTAQAEAAIGKSR